MPVKICLRIYSTPAFRWSYSCWEWNASRQKHIKFVCWTWKNWAVVNNWDRFLSYPKTIPLSQYGPFGVSVERDVNQICCRLSSPGVYWFNLTYISIMIINIMITKLIILLYKWLNQGSRNNITENWCGNLGQSNYSLLL